MTFLAGLALFFTLVALAAIPSASVALVVTRSATRGVGNGAAVAGGIVLGDMIFAALALLGMSALAETMGTFFAIAKMAGGAYLIWLGIGLIRGKPAAAQEANATVEGRPGSLLASFAAGLVLTLGDVKAIVFYASLFPSFAPMERLTAADAAAIAAITVGAVGGVKLAYAFGARAIAARLSGSSASRRLKTASGCALTGAGVYLIAKS